MLERIEQTLNEQFLGSAIKPEACKFFRYKTTVDELEQLLRRGLRDGDPVKKVNRIRSRANTFCKQSLYARRQGGEFLKEYGRGEPIFAEILRILAQLELQLYLDYQTEEPGAPDLAALLEVPACARAIRHMSLVKIAQIIYVEESIKSDIRDLIPERPWDEYPLARAMKRRFVIHYGFTNTGKTYQSLQRLKAAETGVYLSPLRLLALEVQEDLNASGVPCSLLTGEEEDFMPGARHMASTVEKLDIHAEYEVCVIDEAQMIGDSQRGFAWTRAILGVRASEIHVCCAPEALDLLKKILKECGDPFSAVEHRRNTELIYLEEKFNIRTDIQAGDALVAFSKKNVLGIASELFAQDVQASVIYGALPYHTRKKQLERFLAKETDVVVSTDAIGMGLNLPIRRIVFMEEEKFDGTEVRPLRQEEVKQIAGRAGRMGIYDVGYVQGTPACERIGLLLQEPNQTLAKAYLGFSEVLLSIDADILDVLKIWYNMRTSALYTKTDITRTIFLINELRTRGFQFSNRELILLTNIPFSEENQAVFALYIQYCAKYKAGKPIPMPVLPDETLYGLEDYYKCLDLKYSFSKTMGCSYSLPAIRAQKQETADKINEILISQISNQGKSCRSCGSKLPWDYPFGLCEKCFHRR